MRRKQDEIDIDYLARLANLPLPKKKRKKLSRQLEETVDYIELLDQLRTDRVKPTSQVTNLKNVFLKRKEKCLSLREALKNAPRTSKGYFIVPKIKWQ